MTRSKDKSELENLKGIIREQRSKIKNLQKELSRLQKRSHQYEDLEERIQEEQLEKSEQLEILESEKCPKCGKELKITLLGVRVLQTCECGFRKTKKK